MNEKSINRLREILEKEEKIIKKQLERFAVKDKKLKDDWDTLFPLFNGREAGASSMEQAADEVEEYSNLLPVEYNLELKLKNINSALEKIKKNKYGICEKCGKKIPVKRLKTFPETRTCLTCRPLK